MNCDMYSEEECMSSNACFLCITNNNSKCLLKSSPNKFYCDKANPYNYYEYNYLGSIKSRDEYTKTFDTIDETAITKQPTTFNLFSLYTISLQDIGYFLLFIGVLLYLYSQFKEIST